MTFTKLMKSAITIPRMRFVQFMRRDSKRKILGVISEDGSSLVELSGGTLVSDDMISFIKQKMTLQELNTKLETSSFETVSSNHTILPPISNPGKIVCVGLNYKDHCDEQNKPLPFEPIFFSKFPSALVGPRGNVIAHKATNKIDWEVELAVIMGEKAQNVDRKNAMDYVFGYTIAQDISARDWQKERNGGQFLIGKSMDSFCPIGPAIVHKSLIPDVYNLKMRTLVNGVVKQDGNTKDMIFKIDDIIARLSSCLTLLPGDIILTGTPKGVGMHRNPPEFLKVDDIIETEIEGLGRMTNRVVG